MSPANADYFGISEDAAKTGDYGFSFGSYESASDYSQYLISPELTSERGYVETFPATAKYIAIYYTSNYQYYLYVDDFTFQELPTCMPVSGLTASAMQENSITLAWEGEAHNYRVNYRQSGAQTWENCVVNSTSVTLSGLTTGATYECTVVALCSDDNTSIASSALSFKPPLST